MSKTGSYSPALKRTIYITNLIWKHLVKTKTRHKKEILKRLQVLPLARRIIGKTPIITEKRYVGGYVYYALEKKINNTIVKVIITEKLGGKLVLLSVILINQPIKKEAS
ncbi:MAG TPA: hypothetical protein PLS49_06340 [Candidatus Woesebacteria bacterium]|nr:hypothetical protein [Candidatus Woesebacteria bacterium]